MWAACEAAGFILVMLVAYRRMREAITTERRLRWAVGIVVGYGVIVGLTYMAWYYFGSTFTLYGSLLFGCVSSGVHVVLVATLLIFGWRIVPGPRMSRLPAKKSRSR